MIDYLVENKGEFMIHRNNHITRLSKYKMVVKRMRALGMNRVFSENLADALDITASQVRKDFSVFGITGKKKGGYQIDELLDSFNRLLGKDVMRDAVIVGYGNLGKAMAHYSGFEKEQIQIRAIFERDLEKQNPESEVPIFPIEAMIPFIKEHQIRLAILAVPNDAAQEVLDLLVQAGVQGVLNFTSIPLRVPAHVVVHDIDLNIAMETLTFYVFSGQTSKQE